MSNHSTLYTAVPSRILSEKEQYESLVKTFICWVNYQDKTDTMGLLIGLGDYYAEIRIMEEELGMPESERFNLKAALHNRCKNLWILVEDFNVEEPVVEIDVDW